MVIKIGACKKIIQNLDVRLVNLLTKKLIKKERDSKKFFFEMKIEISECKQLFMEREI